MYGGIYTSLKLKLKFHIAILTTLDDNDCIKFLSGQSRRKGRKGRVNDVGHELLAECARRRHTSDQGPVRADDNGY